MRESGCRWTQRNDGRITVVNRCVKSDGGTVEATGVAKVVDSVSKAKLKVSFVSFLGWRPFWGDYWVIGLAEDYSWAVVGTPDRDYLWILSRTPELPDSAWALARACAAENGFDLRRLVRTDNTGGAAARPRFPHALPDAK